ELRAAVVPRRVVLPRRADAAMDGDHLARGEIERVAGGRARGARRERELLGLAVAGPARVQQQRAADLRQPQDLAEAVRDRLVRADRAPEREALLRVGDADLERLLDGADRLGGQQRLGDVPRPLDLVAADVELRALGAVEVDVPERAGDVVA